MKDSKKPKVRKKAESCKKKSKKIIGQTRNAGICWNEMKKATQIKHTIQLAERNRKYWWKKEDKKDIGRDKTIQTKQDIPKQRKKFYQQIGGECTNNWMTMKENNFGIKYGNEEIITEKPNG